MPQQRTHVRVVRSDNREWPSLAVAYRELLGTSQDLGMAEHQRMRAEIRTTGSARDRHGFTWRSLGGAQPEETINWTDFTFGVELEILAPMSIYEMQRRVPERWRVVHDGSLNSGGTSLTPMEVVSPILQGEAGLRALRDVMADLRARGCRVNSSCGLHVHVGIRGMNPARVKKIAIAFINAEVHFDSIVPPSRRANRYCRSNGSVCNPQRLAEAHTIAQLANAVNGGNSSDHYTPFRYYKLNFQSFVRHGTLEFRQHAGSVESDKACAWVRLVTGFCARAAAQDQQPIGAAETFEAWIAACTDEPGARYMTQRRVKFANAVARAA